MTRSVFQRYARNELGEAIPLAEVDVVITNGPVADIFTSETGGVAVSQPMIADVNGYFRFYVEPGLYDVTATDPVLFSSSTFLREEIGTSRESLIDDDQHAKPYSPLNKPEAINVTYDNTTSQLAAEEVQSAIDELAAGGVGGAVRILTTVAEIATGIFSDGDKLTITDRADAKFDVVVGISPNGMDILEADNGNIAVFQAATWINVQWFGALPLVNDVSDNIQRVIDYLDTGLTPINGGVVYFPRGDYLINKTIVVNSAGLPSIAIQGEGILNTQLRAVASFVGSSMIHLDTCTYCSVKDLNLLGASLVNRGLWVDDGNQNRIERVNAEQCLVSPFYMTRTFMLTMTQCRSRGGMYGFDFSGGYNTSLDISNCYANNTDVGGAGFYLFDIAYSCFTACGSDNATGWYGYRVSNVVAVQFIGCGTESSLRSGWIFVASDALDAASEIVSGINVTLDQCFSFNASADGDFGSITTDQIDGSQIQVVVNEFEELNVVGINSVVTQGEQVDHIVRLNDCRFKKTMSQAIYATIDSFDGVRQNARVVTGAQSIVDVSNIFGGTTGQYSGILHVMAGNGSNSSGSSTNVAGYVLLVTKSASSSGVEVVSQNGLVLGGSASHPSFTWSLDTGFNQLVASPIASTSGTFYFHVTQMGALKIKASP